MSHVTEIPSKGSLIVMEPTTARARGQRGYGAKSAARQSSAVGVRCIIHDTKGVRLGKAELVPSG
jgi:hypothetical protein